MITGAPFTDGEDSDLWADFGRETDALLEAEKLSDDEADALRQAARLALVEDLQPAYGRLIEWAENEKALVPEVSTGLSGNPRGAPYYEYLLSYHTTTELTADEIHEIGLEEVARLRGEMEAIREEVGFEGDLQAFFDMLGAEGRCALLLSEHRRRAPGYIDDATAAIDRIKAELPNYRHSAEGRPGGEARGSLPRAGWRRPALLSEHADVARPGTYYAHLGHDRQAEARAEVIVTAKAAGASHADRHRAGAGGLPVFRTQTNFNAYAEGWGHWSACGRDTRHSRTLLALRPPRFGDSRRRATRGGYRPAREGLDGGRSLTVFRTRDHRAQARSEVRRYIVMPGQATGYKIGMLKIQELRAWAENALGDGFDIRAFTTSSGGAMPLTILERRVDNWIATQQTS